MTTSKIPEKPSSEAVDAKIRDAMVKMFTEDHGMSPEKALADANFLIDAAREIGAALRAKREEADKAHIEHCSANTCCKETS